jgi:hypothetical protein
MFGNLLNEINKMDKACINIGVSFYVSPYGHAEIILLLIIKRLLIFLQVIQLVVHCTGYNTNLVTTARTRLTGAYGYYMQPDADGRTGLLFSDY